MEAGRQFNVADRPCTLGNEGCDITVTIQANLVCGDGDVTLQAIESRMFQSSHLLPLSWPV
jgi:hypothetical protein